MSHLMTSTLLEEAFKVIPSQQLLVNVVSKRVRQLTAGHRPMVEAGPRMGFSGIALKEIVEGKRRDEAPAGEPGAGKNNPPPRAARPAMSAEISVNRKALRDY